MGRVNLGEQADDEQPTRYECHLNLRVIFRQKANVTCGECINSRRRNVIARAVL
jgi:hypothetical protein